LAGIKKPMIEAANENPDDAKWDLYLEFRRINMVDRASLVDLKVKVSRSALSYSER
jgi:hypothetical protein